jgi:hypothetical protein
LTTTGETMATKKCKACNGKCYIFHSMLEPKEICKECDGKGSIEVTSPSSVPARAASVGDSNPATPQQQTVPEGEGDIWLLVISDMQRCREFGIQKYGKPVQKYNGRRPLIDAYQEVLDLAVYLRQAIAEEDAAIEAITAARQQAEEADKDEAQKDSSNEDAPQK